MTTLLRSSTTVTIAGAMEELFPRGMPFRFTAYDGSAAGPEDSPIHMHLASERGLSYVLTAPGDLGLVRAYVMGDLEIHVADAHLVATDHWSRWSERVRILHFREKHIPVVPLEWQLVANAMLNRPERVSGISEYLLAHGYDAAYVDELLADQQYGERTIRMAREARKLA